MHKIAFLFLTITGVYHEDYWQDFLRGHEDQYTVYVHSKHGMQSDSFFKKAELPTNVPTSWANTMHAQILLLKEALKDPHNEKFIFASESTLPLADFNTVYSTVMATPASVFFHDRNPHRLESNPFHKSRNLYPIPPEFQYKCAQWIILNRKHAECMAQDTGCIKIVTKYESDQELYPGTLLAGMGLLGEVVLRDTTYVNWGRTNRYGIKRGPPYTFFHLREREEYQCIMQAIYDGFLFARKFGKDTDLSPLDCILPYRPTYTGEWNRIDYITEETISP